MNRLKGWRAAALSSLIVLVAGGLDRPAFASAITGSWSGASVNVTFDTQTQSQQGAMVNASLAGSFPLNYEGEPLNLTPTFYQSTVSGSVGASAGGNPANLLSVTASSNAPDPGTLGHSNTTGFGSAAASWTNDAATVTAAAGSNLPNAIRLDFTLTFSGGHGFGPYSTLTATYNGRQLGYWGTDSLPDYTFGVHSNPSNLGAVDSSKVITNSAGYPGVIQDTFHIDLPLNKSGVSSPFSLSLQLSPFMGLFSNSNVDYSGLTGNIALTGVTLTDGTPLSALGDSVSLESGLILPTAAPEPASFLVWGLTALAAGAIAVRRSRSASQGC